MLKHTPLRVATLHSVELQRESGTAVVTRTADLTVTSRRRPSRRTLFGIAAGALASGLSAPAGRAAVAPLRLGVMPLASHGYVFIAHERGYFRDEGLASELRFYDAAVPVAFATAVGAVDIGITGFTAAFFNLASRGGLKVIAGSSREAPGFRNTAVVASLRADLRSVADLAGRSVGMTQVGSTFHYSLGLIAQRHGFDVRAVKIVALQSLRNIAGAVRRGDVDAALAPASTVMPLVAAGQARLLGFVGDHAAWQLGAVVATPRMIADSRDTIERMLRALRRAVSDYEAVVLQRNADGSFVDTDATDAMLEAVAIHVGEPVDLIKLIRASVDLRLDVADIHRQATWYQQMGFLAQNVEPDSFLDLSFVGAAAAAP